MSPAQSPFDDDVQQCPLCGETIKQGARKCRYCGEMLDGTAQPQGRPVEVDPRKSGPWRDGNLLVARFESELPPRCVKTNEPVEEVVPHHFSWIPSWVIVSFFTCSPLVFYVLSLATQKVFTLRAGCSPAVAAHTRKVTLRALGIGFVAVLFIVYFVAMSMDVRNQTSGAWGIIGFLLFLFALGYWFFMAPSMKVRRIKDDVAWIAGVCPEYLDSLPEYAAKEA